MAETTARTGRPGGTLALIALVCILPVVAAYLVYFLWPPQSQVNYGDLISPRPFSETGLTALDGTRFDLGSLRGRWVMLHVDSAACPESCRKKLYFMRQVRLTQGKDMGRIERLWLVRDAAPPDLLLAKEYEGTHIARAPAAVVSALPAPRDPADHIYLVDPLGNLMLRFPPDPDPSRMKKDLVRLLKVSKVG